MQCGKLDTRHLLRVQAAIVFKCRLGLVHHIHFLGVLHRIQRSMVVEGSLFTAKMNSDTILQARTAVTAFIDNFLLPRKSW